MDSNNSPIQGDFLVSHFTDGFYIVSDVNSYTIVYSQDPTSDLWTIKEQQSHFSFNTNTQISPDPVPTGYTGGFVAVSDYKIFYSSTGAYNDFYLMDAFDYTEYQAWGVVYGESGWIVKLGKIPSGTISPSSVFELYVLAIQSETQYSTPIDINFTSYSDYGLSYSSTQKKYISACQSGIIQSSDGTTWSVVNDRFDYYQFVNLVCSGDRCVGISLDSVVFDSANNGQDFDEITLDDVTTIQHSFPVVSLNNGDPSKAIFVIGSQRGLIYASNTASLWFSDGAQDSDSQNFQNCNQILSIEDTLVVNCESKILTSDDGINWNAETYDIDGVYLESVCGDSDSLVGLGNENEIFSSNDWGEKWTQRAKFTLYPNDNFILSNLIRVNHFYIGVGSDQWINQSNNNSYIPVVVSTENYKHWDVYASNVYIYDVVYSKAMKLYVGAGKYGVFSSDDYYDWQRLFSCNMQCTDIVTDGNDAILSLCSNYYDDKIDELIFVSADGGGSWKRIISPCQTYVPQEGMVDEIHCNEIDYVDYLGGFVIYSQDPSGLMFYSDNQGETWQKVSMPYAARFLGITSTDSLVATLTRSVIFSGDDIEFEGDTIQPELYTQPTNSPDQPTYSIPPGFLLTEPLDFESSFEVPTTLPTSFDLSTFDLSSFLNNQDDQDDQDNLSGGAITGIIFAIMFCLVFIVIALLGAALLNKKRKNIQRRNEQTKLLNDENAML
eukprot:CAMPEP_0117006352 /NCGR_PEP_ID=MMETSP0472-20121206/6614_1 /TAXON_ID=693140 ORGANISM="Tiarina fusus, Strain LIS" /NCGR_SAMPLE_ID=MMETSP0472 /ASSEMBLY_ACC=CAM_ASM_000603 /LENGTH=720 /DNA_ID=CAMNT_0004707799 /DNA_START=184 /DNA_END=2347 /DNA_ORIENTATION=+